ncbi:MAG: hypothetical protein KF690_08275 [Bacteroidetes bacterium]|nr:hypothetical protein [Bacteroidota bacterium]
MKKYLFLPLAALLLLTLAPQVQAAAGDDEVVVTVEKIVGKEKNAEKLKSQLMKLEGVKEVKTCTSSGKVTISYDKDAMGCNSKVYNTMDKNGWAYSKNASCGAAKKSCDKPCNKPCTKTTPQS